MSYSIVFLGTSSASRGTGLARIWFDLESGAATVPDVRSSPPTAHGASVILRKCDAPAGLALPA